MLRFTTWCKLFHGLRISLDVLNSQNHVAAHAPARVKMAKNEKKSTLQSAIHKSKKTFTGFSFNNYVVGVNSPQLTKSPEADGELF